jgi:DNA-binding transcriptional ArsR family regulator
MTAMPALLVLPIPALPALPDHLRVTLELLLALAWAHDRRATPPLSAAELALARGLTPGTLRRHLRALRKAGLLTREAGPKPGRAVHRPHGLAEVDAAVAAPQPAAAAPRSGEAAPRSGQVAPRPGEAAPRSGEVAPRSGAAAPHSGAATPHSGAAAPHSGAATAAQPTQDALSAVVQRLTRAGVYAGLAQELAHKPWVTAALVEAWVRWLRADRQVRHVGAVLTTVLRSPERCLPAPQSPRAPGAPPGSRPHGAARSSSPARASPMPGAQTQGSPALRAPWQQTLTLLQQRIGAEAVRVWLAQSQPVSCDDGTLVVAVCSAQAADWLAHAHFAPLCAAASAAWGRPLRVRLVPGRAHQLG